jgi:hypothetical protein
MIKLHENAMILPSVYRMKKVSLQRMMKGMYAGDKAKADESRK